MNIKNEKVTSIIGLVKGSKWLQAALFILILAISMSIISGGSVSVFGVEISGPETEHVHEISEEAWDDLLIDTIIPESVLEPTD